MHRLRNISWRAFHVWKRNAEVLLSTWYTNLLPPLLLLVVTLLAWQLLVWLLDVKPYVLPAPGSVARAAIREYRDLLAAVWLTRFWSVTVNVISLS